MTMSAIPKDAHAAIHRAKDTAESLTGILLETLDGISTGAISENRANAVSSVVSQVLHVKRVQILILNKAGRKATRSLNAFAGEE